MSHKLHSSGAERQRAYRARQRLPAVAPAGVAPVPVRSPPRPSRPARLVRLREEVRRLSAEYQSWRDRLPPNLANGETATQLDEVISQLDEAGAILDAIDPPAVRRR